MEGALERIAHALIGDYASVYLVDLNTGQYVGYSGSTEYQRLALQMDGQDFFADCRRDIQEVIYEEDRELMEHILTAESIRQVLRQEETVSAPYRLLIEGRPVYHTLRIIRYFPQEDLLILGLMNVDEQIRQKQKSETYNAIARTLATRYSTIYYVDLDTEDYMEYSSNDAYKDLEVPPEGTDFFAESRKNSLRVIHPEDVEKLVSVFDRDNVLRQTEDGRSFSVTYRLMFSGTPSHVRMTAMRSRDGEHLIVGVADINDEVKREQEMEQISERNKVFSQIAESLAAQYGMIYYIDTETDEYVEFTSAEEYKEFNISPSGSDFFGTSQRNVSMIVAPVDRERVFDALNKEKILQALERNGTYNITYQLMLRDRVSYTRMSVVWANDKKHLVMGVMNIDNEIQKENKLRKAEAENLVFSQIAVSLAKQFDTIYYVDMLSDQYVEFASTDIYKSLDIAPTGDDFFGETRQNVERVIHPADRDGILALLDKPALLGVLHDRHMVTHTYRLLVGDGMMYARLSIIWANDNKHLIVGVQNVDEEVRREREQMTALNMATQKAYRDELTGVKNKNAFSEFEKTLQDQIDQGTVEDFAVIICDVNGLKEVNDRQGHKAGDEYIQSACSLICHVFEHSPVFRIGGDEFAVVAQHGDYSRRGTLLQALKEKVLENERAGRVIVACGMSDYRPGEDKAVTAVFERADNLMYENKISLKGART